MKINSAIKFQKERSQRLKSLVFDFKAKFPYASARDASEALGISYGAVTKYFREQKLEQENWIHIGDAADSVLKRIKDKT